MVDDFNRLEPVIGKPHPAHRLTFRDGHVFNIVALDEIHAAGWHDRHPPVRLILFRA
jgi:hypothetical protein